MKRLVFASLAAAAVVCVTSGAPGVMAKNGAGGAQTATAATPQRNWYSVTVVTVKPDSVREWVEIQKSQTIPMQQKGGIKMRETWQSGAPFGDGNTYAMVTPIDKFATYDLPNMPQRILGDGARAYQDKLAALTVSRRTFAVQDRAELSIPRAADAKVVAAILTDITVLGGHADQYEAFIKNDMLPVLKKAKVIGSSVSRTVFGGNANEYHSLLYLDSFAEIDKGPPQVRVLGEAGAQALLAKLAPHVATVERTILRYVPDLSYQARPSS